jgi:hypothetical protein
MKQATAAMCCGFTLLAGACGSNPSMGGGSHNSLAAPDHTREKVERSLGEIERGMSMRTWDRVQKFFSRDYYGGMSELRNSIEDNWRKERNVNLQFLVNRLNEQDGLINAQVRWNKSFVDNSGAPQKRSGVAEFVLKAQGGSYQILKMSGDRPF